MVNKIDWKYNIWKKGEYIDLWSLNHFVGGVLIARILLFFDLSFWSALSITFVVKVAWEIYELIRNIKEPIGNKILDVVMGIIGFLVMYYLYIKVSFFSKTTSFIIIFVIWLFLNLWGYVVFVKRTKKLIQ